MTHFGPSAARRLEQRTGAQLSDSLFTQERERFSEMLVSASLKYIPVAYDYAVEVPSQNPLDRISRGLPISNASEADESMRSKMSDVPEQIEQRRFSRCFRRKVES